MSDDGPPKWMTPAQLAARWHTEEKTLANQRALGVGVPFTKDPNGRISYATVDVLQAERDGARGPSLERLDAALRAALEAAHVDPIPPRRYARLLRKLWEVGQKRR